MFKITMDFSWRVRKNRALHRLSLDVAARQIGISRKTLSLIESEKKKEVTKTVYQKLVNWLLTEKESEVNQNATRIV